MYLFLLLISLSFNNKVQAQWDGNSSTVNNLITTASAGGAAITVSDKYGGAIRAWELGKSIYIQRKTVGGIVSWNDVSDPVEIFQDASSNYIQIGDMIPDDNGGVYISWMNHLTPATSDLYVQHIGSNGQKSWGADGIKINPAGSPLCTEGRLCLSGDDVIIVWGTEKMNPIVPSPDSSLLFIQKIDRTGQKVWTSSAIPVSTAPGFKFWPVISADSSNGVYISFTDTRNSTREMDGTYNNFDIFIQHFNSAGQQLWPFNDIAISIQPFHQTSYNDYAPTSVGNRPSMLTDGEGNIIILYENYIDNSYPDTEYLEAQKLNFSGIYQWNNAVKVNQQQTNKLFLQLAPDKENGLVICWKNVQAAGTVYAQRVTNSGTLPWGTNGITVNNTSEIDFGLSDISMVNDEEGNYIVTWRMDTTTANFEHTQYLKAQKFNNSGTLLWSYPGVLISAVDNDLPNIPQIVKSIDNATLFTWKCARGLNAALVNPNGSLRNQPVMNFTAIASGNWDDPSVWAGNMVPPAGANIIITQNITVNVNIICNSIIVQPTTVLTINPGVNVTIFNN
ncbi:MAG: hypothetical protein H7Y86_15550 [Rhizobacter sp.]|nr:hypothetical protein [Ferruginibacter sp.]